MFSLWSYCVCVKIWCRTSMCQFFSLNVFWFLCVFDKKLLCVSMQQFDADSANKWRCRCLYYQWEKLLLKFAWSPKGASCKCDSITISVVCMQQVALIFSAFLFSLYFSNYLFEVKSHLSCEVVCFCDLKYNRKYGFYLHAASQ